MTMNNNPRAVVRREFITRISLGAIGAGLAGSLAGRHAAAAETLKPNLVFINIDELLFIT